MKSRFTTIIAFATSAMVFGTTLLSHAAPDSGVIEAADQSATLSEDQSKAAFGGWGIETQHISKSVKPGDDFFTYVNEGWIKSTKIPAGYWDYGQTSILGAHTDQTRSRYYPCRRQSIRAQRRLAPANWRPLFQLHGHQSHRKARAFANPKRFETDTGDKNP